MTSHWLDQYASDRYTWQQANHDGRVSFFRQMGLVEQAFDADGRYHEGRADMGLQVDVELSTGLSPDSVRHHTLLAFACLRARHVLLQVKAPSTLSPWLTAGDKHQFQVDAPISSEHAVEEARLHSTFLQDHYSTVDALSFYNAAQNCARLIEHDKALARLLVLPAASRINQSAKTSYILITAHQIGDGIAMGEWIPDFIRLLNMPDHALTIELATLIEPESIRTRLPLPQEALYPPISGSAARRRWFWLLTRILRHVRRPLPAGFSNPLLRKQPSSDSVIERRWDKILDYSRRPSNGSATCRARTSRASTLRLTKICRDAGVSIGAGCFALAALLMMEFYEQQEPNIELEKRRPFITGFPLNPRPFLKGNPAANSLMLAFSDGIMLPFLPSSLDLDGRLRLLARQAQRQLAVYQKRINPAARQNELRDMGSRGAGRMLAIQYIGSIERQASLAENSDQNFAGPQGGYPMRPNMTRQTCGVSSTGKGTPLASRTKYENPDFVATPIELHAGVRAREGEFLIGIGGSDAGLRAAVSLDTSSMDPDLVAAWRHRFENILEQGSLQARL